MTQYVRTGVQYGATKGAFRDRWWNYYERGRSFLEGGFPAEAESDFRTALAGRGRDQLWPRTYGLHFIPEYFPHRELGIALFHQGQVEESIPELERSLSDRFSARAAYYLDEARKKHLESQDVDKHPPEVTVSSPDATVPIGDMQILVSGVAHDDTYVAAVTINGHAFDVRVSAPEVAFSYSVPMEPGDNAIEITATDLLGKSTTTRVNLQIDIDGPVVSFDSPLVFPGQIAGIAYDPSGIAAVWVGGREAAVSPGQDGQTSFSIELPQGEVKPPVLYEAEDGLGNKTRGRLPVDLVVLSGVPQGPVFAKSEAEVSLLRGGVRALNFQGRTIALAAAASNAQPLSVELGNIRDGQEYFMDEIVVALDIACTDGIASVELNDEPVNVMPNRPRQRVSRRLRLEPGANEIAVAVCDTSGRSADDRRTVMRGANDIEQAKGKLGIAFLSNVAHIQNTATNAETEGILDLLAATETVSRRFTVVDRSLLAEVLQEQELVLALASRKGKLELGKVVPAEVMFVPRIRRDPETIEIVLEGIGTETGVRVAQRVDVAGPLDDIERLVDDLGVRLSQEFPRVTGHVISVEEKATQAPTLPAKPAVAFVNDSQDGPDGVSQRILERLSASDTLADRFVIVDRTLIDQAVAEQDLSESVGTPEGRLALGRLVSADALIAMRVAEAASTLTVVLEIVNPETSAALGQPIIVSGSEQGFEDLLNDLEQRLAADLPPIPVRSRAARQPRFNFDLGRNQGLREYLKCLVYRMEDVADAKTGEVLGSRPVIVREGLIDNVGERASSAETTEVLVEDDQRIEAGQYVVTK